MLRKISTILVPMAVLFAAWVIVFQIPLLSPEKQELAPLAPYLLLFAGLLLACHFRRGRVLLATLVVGSCYYLFRTHLTHGTDTPEAWLIYHVLMVLVPLNILLIALMREKGVWTMAGRMRLSFLVVQILAVWLTVRLDQHAVWVALTRPLVNWPALERFAMPQLSLILILLAACVALRRAVTLASPIEGSMFACCVTIFVVFRWRMSPHVPETFCAASALIQIMAVIQDSYNMAFRDDLTGLHSRRVLNERLTSLGSRYAIAMVDVDHFKNFNDAHGHDVGDQVLKMVGARLMDITGGGSPFRYGGEEFTVLFPGKSAKEAHPHLERLRQAIADYRMTLRGEDRPRDEERGKGRRSVSHNSGAVSVSVSIGVAEPGERYRTPRDVLKAADEALYKAKNKGRNQTCLAVAR